MPRTTKRSKHLQQARATKNAKLDTSLSDLDVSTASLSLSLSLSSERSSLTDGSGVSTASVQAHDESTVSSDSEGSSTDENADDEDDEGINYGFGHSSSGTRKDTATTHYSRYVRTFFSRIISLENIQRKCKHYMFAYLTLGTELDQQVKKYKKACLSHRRISVNE